MRECSTSLSEPYGIYAAKVHVTSYTLQSYYTAYLHISVFLLCCCCFLLSFSPTSLHIHSILQVWTFLLSPYIFGGFILVLTPVRIKIIPPICGMTFPSSDKLQEAQGAKSNYGTNKIHWTLRTTISFRFLFFLSFSAWNKWVYKYVMSQVLTTVYTISLLITYSNQVKLTLHYTEHA
jgi:hypothetical protein